MFLAAVQVRAVSLPLPLHCVLFLEHFLSLLTSGVCLQQVDSPAMGLPVFELDGKLQQTSANISQRGNAVDLILYILTAVGLIVLSAV